MNVITKVLFQLKFGLLFSHFHVIWQSVETRQKEAGFTRETYQTCKKDTLFKFSVKHAHTFANARFLLEIRHTFFALSKIDNAWIIRQNEVGMPEKRIKCKEWYFLHAFCQNRCLYQQKPDVTAFSGRAERWSVRPPIYGWPILDMIPRRLLFSFLLRYLSAPKHQAHAIQIVAPK